MSKNTMLGLALMVLCCAIAPLRAREAVLAVAELDGGNWTAAGLELALSDAEEATAPSVLLRLQTLALPTVDLVWHDIEWRCSLARDALSGWRCTGDLSWRAQKSKARRTVATLDLSANQDALNVEWQRETATVSARLALGDVSLPSTLAISQLPLVWLDAVLGQLWPAGKLSSGKAGAQLSVLRDSAGKLRSVDGNWRVDALDFDSVDGRVGGAGLNAQGEINIGFEAALSKYALEGQLSGGEFLSGPLYVALPKTPVAVAVKIEKRADGSLRLERFSLDDPDTLRIVVDAELAPAPDNRLVALEVRELDARLPLAYQRYAQSWLATRNLGDLETSGSVSGTFKLHNDQLAAFDLGFKDMAVADARGRFAIAGIQGGLAWDIAKDLPARELSWTSASLYDLPVAAGAAQSETRAGRLQLARPLAIKLLDGSLSLEALGWRPGTGGAQFSATLGLAGISVAKLSRELAWPEFGGTLSGQIPEVSYANEVFTLAGGLDLTVFDGKIAVSGMALERPFGVAPTLSADLVFSNLDLKLLTGAFSFGEIQGRLEGQVKDLRLVDWTPVHFDADLHTVAKDKGPRRISQRAMQSLSSVGGGGLVAGIQSSVLRVFETFGYEQIGLKCKLDKNVCRMDGLDSVGNGYHIVKGAGIPRISVIGHQRRVDWPVLVGRLKATTAGVAPIIR